MTSEQYQTLAEALGDLSKFSPRMQAYLRIKARQPEIMLFYRMGDFYELFFDDAEEASRLLNITLMSRRQLDGVPIKMAGIPYHHIDWCLARLAELGVSAEIVEEPTDYHSPASLE